MLLLFIYKYQTIFLSQYNKRYIKYLVYYILIVEQILNPYPFYFLILYERIDMGDVYMVVY